MRLRRIGDDFLHGCALDFEQAATSDADALALAIPDGDDGDPVGALARTAAAVTTGRDLEIARRLRAAGLVVVEVEGWRNRGDAVLNPKGHTTHHTAGAATGMTPSLRICVEGRSDLRGPLCNWFLGRDRKAYVVASGRANHAGSGSFAGISGNSLLHGVEVEHTGRSPLPDDMVVILTIGVAALSEDRYSHETVHQHHEYSSAGKIDIATNFHDADDPAPSKNEFRRMVGRERDLLRDVERSTIVFPTSGRRADGAWRRNRVVVPTGRVDEWLVNHPGVLERRGRGSGVEIRPAK